MWVSSAAESSPELRQEQQCKHVRLCRTSLFASPGYLISRFVTPLNYKWTATVLDATCDARSMRTCMNISTVIWSRPGGIARVPRLRDHSRLSQGCMFSLGLSISYKGQIPETNLDNPEVSR